MYPLKQETGIGLSKCLQLFVAHLSPALRSSRRHYSTPCLALLFSAAASLYYTYVDKQYTQFTSYQPVLEDAAYVTNAYVPLQLLCCKRVERETLCRAAERLHLLPGAFFSWGGKSLAEDGSIRNECVRSSTVALPLYLGRERVAYVYIE